MKGVKKINQLFGISVLALFLMSACILLMPLPNRIGEENRIMIILLGGVFWVTAIIGYLSIFLAGRECKCLIKKEMITEEKSLPGIGKFFSNPLAKVADVTMIISIMLFVIINFTDLIYEYISYIILFFVIFSLNMHCLFNGRIYKMTKMK